MNFLNHKRKQRIDHRNRNLAERHEQGWRSIYAYATKDLPLQTEIGRYESVRFVA